MTGRSRAAARVLALALFAPALAPADEGSIARGEYLYKAAGCEDCHAGARHGSGPVGGLGLDTPFGTFRAPNITPDPQFGIGAWSLDDFRTALRRGVGRRGELLFPVFPYTSFTRMTDADIADLYTYLRNLEPGAVANRPHEARAPFSWRPLLAFWRAWFFTPGPVPADPRRSDAWNRGNYLVHAVVHCEECHTPRNALGAIESARAFSGNLAGPDRQNAPNITPDVATGIGGWSIEDLVTLLKTGMTPESDLVGSGMKAVVRGTSRLTDADRRAIAVYLKSVAPIHSEPPPNPPTSVSSK